MTPVGRPSWRPLLLAAVPGGLFLVLLGLQLGDALAWPWSWVTAPLWAPPAAGLVYGVVLRVTRPRPRP